MHDSGWTEVDSLFLLSHVFGDPNRQVAASHRAGLVSTAASCIGERLKDAHIWTSRKLVEAEPLRGRLAHLSSVKARWN